jgi:hypothetical protein
MPNHRFAAAVLALALDTGLRWNSEQLQPSGPLQQQGRSVNARRGWSQLAPMIGRQIVQQLMEAAVPPATRFKSHLFGEVALAL